eukprot:15443487-Alexandrium_andersonii.AAC.1
MAAAACPLAPAIAARGGALRPRPLHGLSPLVLLRIGPPSVSVGDLLVATPLHPSPEAGPIGAPLSGGGHFCRLRAASPCP